MGNALFNHKKELRGRLGVLFIYCLCLAVFSYGAFRAVYALLTVDSHSPLDHMRYTAESDRARVVGPEAAGDQADRSEEASVDPRAFDVESLQTVEDYIRYARSFSDTLSPLEIIETMGLRDPFSAPFHLVAEVDTPAGSSPVQSFTGIAKQQPAGIARAEQLVSFPKGVILPGGPADSLVQVGSQFALMYARLRLSRAEIGVDEDRTGSSDPRVVDEDRVSPLGPRVVGEVQGLTQSYQESSAMGRSMPGSMALFPWLESVDTVVGPRTGLSAVAPTALANAAVPKALEGAIAKSVAPGTTPVSGMAGGPRSPYELLEPYLHSSDGSVAVAVNRPVLGFVGLPRAGEDGERPTRLVDTNHERLPVGAGIAPAGETTPTDPTIVAKSLDSASFTVPRPIGVAESPVTAFESRLTPDQSALAQTLDEPASGPVHGIDDARAGGSLIAPSPASSEESSSEPSADPPVHSAEDEGELDRGQGMESIEDPSSVVIPRPRTPVVADSPVLEEQEFVEDTAQVVWPSISVTGIVVTSEGRAKATIRLSGQHKVIQPGDRLGELEVVSIGRDYIEVGLLGEVRQYRIGDGPVE